MCNNVVWWARPFQCATILVESTKGSDTPPNLVQCLPNLNNAKSTKSNAKIQKSNGHTHKSNVQIHKSNGFTNLVHVFGQWRTPQNRQTLSATQLLLFKLHSSLITLIQGHEHGDSWVQGDYFLYTYVHLQADIYTPTKLVWLPSILGFLSLPLPPVPLSHPPVLTSHPAAALFQEEATM